jgi:diguanylate cyclase (GGDEF)-like protein
MTPTVIFQRVQNGALWDYTFVGDRVLEFFGSPQNEVFRTQQGFDFTFIHQEDRVRVAKSYRELAHDGGGLWKCDFRIVSRSGAIRWINAFAEVQTTDRRETQSVVMLVDVGQASVSTLPLAAPDDYDQLTGLYSRPHFERAIAEAAKLHESIDSPFAIVAFDIDDFHEINEAHGFDAGDQLLRAIGRAATEIGRGAIIGRLESDRFAVLIDAAEASDAVSFAGDLLAYFKRPFSIENQLMWISASAGITFSTELQKTPIELMHEAESALRKAHESGGATFRVYSPEMNDEILSRFALKESLHEATDKEQFELHYQPKIDLASDRVVGAEALIRWSHPELGMQSPARFIPIAERTGLILPIGEWVIRQACRQYAEWRRAGIDVVPIAVNVSAVQFARSDMSATISRALLEFQVPPSALEIEITEGMLVDCTDELIAQLQAIRKMGVGIALDDFGIGFSSLAYLQRLPLSIIKIDQGFVRGALTNERDAAIVRSITHLAKQLDMRTVAEGVETVKQLAFVRQCGCQEAQGYLFSPPLFPADFAWFLKGRDSPKIKPATVLQSVAR